jgi:tubulin polyglutamylase TTLL6/13
LTRKLEDIDPHEHCVVQRYIHKPLLIEGLKFDLRIYVLLSGVDPLRIYMYEEGLARFATEQYTVPKDANLNKLYMHLTNYAINKNNKKFISNKSANKDSIGHKRSLTYVFRHLAEKYGA